MAEFEKEAAKLEEGSLSGTTTATSSPIPPYSATTSIQCSENVLASPDGRVDRGSRGFWQHIFDIARFKRVSRAFTVQDSRNTEEEDVARENIVRSCKPEGQL
jgi:hypothetical protein